MSRVLKTGSNQITQSCSSSHVAVDVVKYSGQLDYIIAHSDGEVVWVQTGYGNNTNSTGLASYGNAVKIKHNNGYYTLYAHMKNISVKKGQRVSKGQTIGYMSNSGRAFGSHLHFEVRNKSDVKIDPTPYIDKDLPNTSSTPNYTGVITYKVYTNKWLPEVSKCDNTSNGYAGIFGQAITGIKVKPQYGEINIQVHIIGGGWMDYVSSKNYNNNTGIGYAGIYGKPIDMVRIKSTVGYVSYRTHTKGGSWNNWVDSRTQSGTESYAGIPSVIIDGIQMK